MPNADPPIARALISVSDKTGIEAFGRFLAERGVEILSTGGTAKALAAAAIEVKEVNLHTGFPEIMEGRVKTLHPLIHGGILARRDNTEDMLAMAQHAISAIDLVVVNLYPFERTAAGGADFDTCIETIDIGGPAMIRAAAKNHTSVTVVTDIEDYEAVMDEMGANDGATTAALRRSLAATAFARTAAFDAAIAEWFAGVTEDAFPRRVTFAATRAQHLRYGENPHQQAAFYRTTASRPGVATATQIQGKELSYNNLNDTDAAFELVAEFDQPTTAIIKHANPCGVAVADSLRAAYEAALRCDPISAFGGIIALNRTLDADTAGEIVKLFAEVVIAPGIDAAARAILAGKKNLRVLETGGMPDPTAPGTVLKAISGGFLFQSRDSATIRESELKVVTERAPTNREVRDLLFAFAVCKHVKSNAIVYARDGATVGIGAGQMSRVDSAHIAAEKAAVTATEAGRAEPLTVDSVVASDAFFPFADGLLAAARAGATAVIQPGGSRRDDEVIAAANENGLAMVFTGRRHFRH